MRATGRGCIVIASLDGRLNDREDGDLVSGDVENILNGPFKGILGVLGAIQGKDNMAYSLGIAHHSF